MSVLLCRIERLAKTYSRSMIVVTQEMGVGEEGDWREEVRGKMKRERTSVKAILCLMQSE